jgi:phosphatidylglycerophosphatase A
VDTVQNLPGGLGIMADDVLAGFAAGLLTFAGVKLLG